MHTQIGFTRKAHGLAGELKLHIEDKFVEDLMLADVLFLEIRGQKVPYFVESVRDGNELLLKLEDISDRTAAEPLQAKPIFLKDSDLLEDEDREYEAETLEYDFAEGWILRDATLGELGKIDRVIEFPQQEMAVVLWKEVEVLIPLNPVFIKNVDEKNQIIDVDLPEGLLE
jgi:16S rRNA processing protein RimM